MIKSGRISSLFLVLFVLCGCVPVHSGSMYMRSEMGRAATVMKGKILSVRQVSVSGTNSGVGAGSGAVAGGAAGSMMGGSTEANIIGAVGGAVVGGIAGAVAEEALTRAGAVEFIVGQENGQTIAVVQTNEEDLDVGDEVLILRSGKVRIIRDTTIKR